MLHQIRSRRQLSFLFLLLSVEPSPRSLEGFVAGRLGNLAPYKNATVLGVLGIFYGIYIMDSNDPLWFNVAGLLRLVPASLLGGYIAVRRSEAQADAAAPER